MIQSFRSLNLRLYAALFLKQAMPTVSRQLLVTCHGSSSLRSLKALMAFALGIYHHQDLLSRADATGQIRCM